MTAALDAGADYVGLVFFPRSPRNVTLEQAGELATLARGRSKIVALTVDPDDRLIETIIKIVAPDFIQLHGREPPQRVAQISQTFKIPVMKAIKVATVTDAAVALDYRDAASLILFDAKVDETTAQARHKTAGQLPGGNGLTFDWSALDDIKDNLDFMLSGGLNANNVGDAIRATGAVAVDVSSGVELAPGIKDLDKIKAFFAAVRSIDEV